MDDRIKFFVGLDSHKNSISVAPGRQSFGFLRMQRIEQQLNNVRKA